MKYIAFLILLISTSNLFGQDKIIGTWLSEDKQGRTRFYKVKNKYYGKLVWMANPNDKNGKPLKDVNNPNPKLRHKTVLNLTFISGLTYDADDKEWVDGKVYDHKSGKTYNCSVHIKNNTLFFRGYLGWLYDTKEWTKYK